MNTDRVLALAREACKIGGIDVTTADNQLIMGNRDIIKFAALLQREMEAENAELRKDAERYRWLRSQSDRDDEGHCYIAQDEYVGEDEDDYSDDFGLTIHWLQNDEADEAIDRARSANDRAD